MLKTTPSTPSSLERRIYTVSELTTSIKVLLESEFPFIWISGEVSNFRKPSSGHYYFTLKDENAQIASVMFRNQNRGVHFELEDGLHIMGLGRISVYEPRGTYQIILEYLEPKGIGALQIAYEQLRDRLKKDGLFDQNHKTIIPYLPRKISLVTSPSGAVVHDIITIVQRRFPNMPMEILPVKVQGQGAVSEIVEAFQILNARMDSDLIILARGGGSLEDMQPFNSEEVARSIYHSQVPVISAVGHETDFTIADFVADLRAPTPSAAAELAVPVRNELILQISSLQNQLNRQMLSYIRDYRNHLKQVSNRLPKPRKTIQDLILRVDDYQNRIALCMVRLIKGNKEKLKWISESLVSHNPVKGMIKVKFKLEQLTNKLQVFIIKLNTQNKNRLDQLHAQLHALNPKAILQRGYTITRALPEGNIVRSPDDVALHGQVDVMLARGSMICRVERKMSNGQENL
ncbi:MAG: exodeoxyribonuclease VII large subunit [Proteobacteria bacterium]|nr:exodeoxyribonuclease VII large subunit [Pseudomonadota bacterium]MBU4471566.1 exodeoxyribonuclease VII large subunit [Pseudomonadota bacterium]MCG2752572.1 exodeoxyribonuclease VII large subunit [Desulfobacteraceae bacterium]